jgi:pre-rRNA-processing protein IPI3
VEPITPLASTGDGHFIVGGGASGRVYVWEVSTGRLLRSWPAHYKSVTCLVFSDDDSLLISGGDDGIVSVWPLVK